MHDNDTYVQTTLLPLPVLYVLVEVLQATHSHTTAA